MSDQAWQDIRKHIAAEDGSAKLAIKNIVCHFDVLLSDEQKAAINWHREQSVSLAVMRLIDIDNYRRLLPLPPPSGASSEPIKT